MKKLFIGLAAIPVVSALAMTACGSSGGTQATTTAETTTIEATTTEAATVSESTTIVGGWTINEEVPKASVTDEAKKAFDKAIEGYVGMDLETVALVGTQLVSGTNYHILCKGKPVTANPAPEWDFAVVYQDLNGNASITNVVKLDTNDIKTVEKSDTGKLAGAWEIQSPSGTDTLPSDAAEKFAKAAESYTDVKLSPYVLLATQVVAGQNYMILCEGTTSDGEKNVYAATMYVDTEGKAEIIEAKMLDMSVYQGVEE